MMYLPLLMQRSRARSDRLQSRIFARFMGGGPRTFLGGHNKWQWKPLHERRAREKEKRLLEQEKQLYQSRVRSQIRASLAGISDLSSISDNGTTSYGIKALAGCFMKEAAEDLWNEDDGPLSSPLRRSNERGAQIPLNQRPRSINSPVDLRKLMTLGREGENSSYGFSYTKVRGYSVQRSSYSATKIKKSEISWSIGVSACRDGDKSKKRHSSPHKDKRFRRQDSSSSDEDDDYAFVPDEMTERRAKSVREIGSKASLGKYDVKFTKRVPLNKLEEEEDPEKELHLIRHELEKRKLAKSEAERDATVEEVFSQKRFDEFGLSPLTLKALAAARYVQMTRVQEATLSLALEGRDAIVKARTGTGKSAAFLLPAIETVLKSKGGTRHPRVSPAYVLILCPTRELASQLAAEANALLKYHDGIGVLTLVGGTRFKDDQKRLESNSCQIVVATPGRLLDHIENKGGLSMNLMALKMLIVDEADHLLDLGFRKDVEKIVDCLPRQRQSLMFSATIPKEVRRLSQLILKREHDFVDTVGLGCVETPSKVKQSLLVVPHECHFHVLHQILREHILRTPDYKVIVFCTTGMVTSLLYTLLREMKLNVRELHSRKPQLHRTRVCDEFKESKRSILVTSDVSARGMNYPDVTLVIQVGIPTDREQYIHRIGRTGREGKDGEGILLLAPWEEYFANELQDLPLNKLSPPCIDLDIKLKVEESMSKIDSSIKEAAYHAWLGYYNSIPEISRDKTSVAELASKFAGSIGLQKPPPLFRKTALKMGLKDIPGIRIRT